jgi:hypothetical protein
MKLIEIVNARESLQKLVGQELPLRVAYRLVKVTDAINFHLNFYGEELMKLGENPDPEKLKELEEMEITDLHHEKLRVPIMEGLVLSAADVKMLEPFIEFYEEGEG